jgi:hypothetical protein
MPPDAPFVLADALRPDWAAPPSVGALMSTRVGGVSGAPFDSLNLRPAGLRGDAVDDPAAIGENQRRFAAALGAAPVWLDQVHGADVVRLTGAPPTGVHPRADASVTTVPGLACAVLVADCLPVLLCDARGRAVGAAHAGWRGLAAGVLENTVHELCGAAQAEPHELHAWLGACIGPRQFEVGADVLQAFGPAGAGRFVPRARPDGTERWLANLAALARDRLAAAGVTRVAGGHWCTVEERSRFFSFRRDRLTGRMAAAIWLRG